VENLFKEAASDQRDHAHGPVVVSCEALALEAPDDSPLPKELRLRLALEHLAEDPGYESRKEAFFGARASYVCQNCDLIVEGAKAFWRHVDREHNLSASDYFRLHDVKVAKLKEGQDHAIFECQVPSTAIRHVSLFALSFAIIKWTWTAT